MYAFNSAAIFSPGHPYIESTTVLSDTGSNVELGAFFTTKRLLHAQNSLTLFIYNTPRGNQYGTKLIRNGNETNKKRSGSEIKTLRRTIVLRIWNGNFILTATVQSCIYMYTRKKTRANSTDKGCSKGCLVQQNVK